MAVSVKVLPSPKCLFDDPIQIKVEGLSPLQEVTLRASLTDENGELFQSFAYYRAESNGELDLTCSSALAGSYSGVEPMGLLWSLESETPFKRLAKKNVLTPFYVHVEVFEGHDITSQLLDKCINERKFLGEGVKRIPVREGRLKATLFLPPDRDLKTSSRREFSSLRPLPYAAEEGEKPPGPLPIYPGGKFLPDPKYGDQQNPEHTGSGPFPGLIDLYGTGGGLVEYRASLLASRGFVTLALAYLAFEDIPALPDILELDYFGEAVEFLRKQQQVKGTGIGVLGLSKGADLALSLATFLPGIQAAVSISGCGVNSFIPLHVNGFTIPPHPGDFGRIKTVGESGMIDYSEVLDDPRDPATWACRIPVEKSPAKLLFLSAQDDRNWKSELYCREVVHRLRQCGRDVEFYCYPGAGHLLEPPYLPLCQASIHKLLGACMLWGGQWREHARAQEDAWHRIQVFFRQHLLDSDAVKSNL